MNIEQLIVSFIAILIGAGILFYAGTVLRNASNRKNWPQTTGEIISSGVNKIDGDEGPLYYPAVRYRYRVNSVEYESNVIAASLPPYAEAQRYAKSIVDKYQPRNTVTVYYNPENVREAMLDTNASSSGVLLLLILGIPILFCGLLLFLGFLTQAGIF